MSSTNNQNNYEPRRFGLRYQPPQIVLEYWCPSRKKLYHHIIKLHKLKKDSSLKDTVHQIYIDHKNYLVNKVQESQIENLVEMLIGNLKSNTKENKLIIDKNLNLNELENEEIDKYKGEMEKLFKKNSVKEDDPEYVYDKREEFVGKINDPEWDIDIEETFDL